MAEDLGNLIVKLTADTSDLKKNVQQARGELEGFQITAERLGSMVRNALMFVGVTASIGGIIYKLKEFANEALQTGANVELLRLATYGLGEGLGMSAGTIDYWVKKVRDMKMGGETAWKAVQTFIKTGLDLTQIEKFVAAVQNIAPLAQMSVGEAMDAIMRSIATGATLALRQVEIPRALLQSLTKEAGQDAGAIQGRFQLILDFITSYGAQMEGVSAKVGSAFLKQTAALNRATEEAKTALFDNFLKPMASAITGEKIKVWQDLANWITNNKEKLIELGTGIGIVVRRFMEMVSFFGRIIASSPDWAGYVVSIWALSKGIAFLLGPLGKIATTFTGASTAGGALLIILGRLKLALVALVAHPWILVISLVIVGAAAGLKKLYEEVPETAPLAMAGEAFGLMTPEQQRSLEESGEALKRAKIQKGKAEIQEKEVTPASQAEKEAREAAEKQRKALDDLLKNLGGAKDAAKGAAKTHAEDLLKYLTEYLEAKRKLELKDAEESVKILKAEQDRKRAELELWRHEGQISHQEYYQSLKILAEDETKATLNLIDTKIAKEKEAYDWARKAVAEKSGKGEISPEAQELALKKLLVEHTTRLKEMDVEALTAKINLQKTLLGVLKEELGNRERIQDMLASGAEAAALGPIAEKEAQINNLLRERAKLRQGLSGEDLAQFDRLTGPLVLKERYGNEIRELGASFRGMFEEVVDGIFAGGKSLEQAFDRMWRNLLNIAIRPAMNAIEQIIINFFTNLFKNIGGGGGGGWLKGWAGGGQTPAPFDWSAQPFQHGGLVTRPLLGLVGEAGPEAIIPLDKMGQYGGVNLTLNVINNTRTPVEASVQRSEDSMDLVLDEAMATTFNRQGKFARTLVSGLTTNFRLTKR